MPEQVPSWYHGATGDWAAAPIGPSTPHIPSKGEVQDTIRTLTGKKDINDTSTSPATDWPTFLKSLVTDAASQAPLALIPEGNAGKTALRGAASILAGTGADQLFNPQRPLADSGIDAITNTGVGMAIPHLLANEFRYNPTPIQGTGVSAKALKILSLIDPTNWSSSPRTETVPTNRILTRSTPRVVDGKITKQVIRTAIKGTNNIPSNIGTDLSNKLFVMSNGKVNLDPKTILNLFGFGANAALDSTVNRPTKDQNEAQ